MWPTLRLLTMIDCVQKVTLTNEPQNKCITVEAEAYCRCESSGRKHAALKMFYVNSTSFYDEFRN